jgi:hypothetical protein
LAANDIVSLLRDYAIDFNMYKNAVEELTKRGVVEMNDRIYEVVPGEQGYRMQAVGGVEWVDTPEPAPAPILAIPAHVGELVIDVHPMPEPEIEDEDTQPAPLAPQFVDVDHEKMIRKFIVAKCETGRNKKIKTRDLYAAYAQWCKDGSIDAIDNINFSKILIGFEFKAVRSNGTRYMRGICLVEEPAVSQVPAGIA